MTTKNSPYPKLKAQADKMAAILKHPRARANSKNPEAETVKIGVLMDDKGITIETTWAKIAETEEAALAEYLVRLMQEVHDERTH